MGNRLHLLRPGTPLLRRLLPLHIATFLQGFLLWPPIEKLFMAEIGFDATAVGVMAAVYAAVVPILEVPSGILADRWSRRGVLVVGTVALGMCALIGGLATSVPGYIVSALFLGGYFAMYSGTVDSMVYDTVLEDTGGSGAFEERIGRMRLIESVALVGGSLLGGWIAELAGTRLTYLLSIPFAALSIVFYCRFREPQLHRAGEPTALRRHVSVTVQTLARGGRMLPIVTLAVLSGVVLQLLLEFGPLWLVALAVPAVLYGPYWAVLVSTLGLGGLLAGRLPLDKSAAAVGVGTAMTAAGVALAITSNILVVMVAQALMALLVVVAGIHLTRLLHDQVPSGIRAGVASGVGALTWMVFLPVALAIGLATDHLGVGGAGWILTVLAAISGGLLVRLAVSRRPARSAAGR